MAQDEITREIRKLENTLNWIEMKIQESNLLDTAKGMLTKIFILANAYVLKGRKNSDTLPKHLPSNTGRRSRTNGT